MTEEWDDATGFRMTPGATRCSSVPGQVGALVGYGVAAIGIFSAWHRCAGGRELVGCTKVWREKWWLGPGARRGGGRRTEAGGAEEFACRVRTVVEAARTSS